MPEEWREFTRKPDGDAAPIRTGPCAFKEFKQEIGFGGDYHTLEDFAQGIQLKAGTVLVPDAGRIGGVSMLSQAADLAKDARPQIAPVVQGGPCLSWRSPAPSHKAKNCYG